MQGKLDADDGYVELTQLGRVTCINLVDDGTWKGKRKGSAQKSAITDDLNKFLALATHIMAKLNGESEKKGGNN